MVKYFPKGIYLQVDFPSINFLNGNFPNVQYPKGQVRPSKAPQAAIGAECCGQDGIEVLAPQLEQARGRALWLGQTWENVFGKLPNILKITWTVPSNDFITVLYRYPLTPELDHVRKHVLPKIMKHPLALPFKHPVDAITEGIYPDYFLVSLFYYKL